jgi:hypothetical protein
MTNQQTLKVQILLDVEYDMPPTRRNKIDIQKLLALELFRLGDVDYNKLSFEDVPMLHYDFKIITNPQKLSPKDNKYNNGALK